jgi:hypothetical protein
MRVHEIWFIDVAVGGFAAPAALFLHRDDKADHRDRHTFKWSDERLIGG